MSNLNNNNEGFTISPYDILGVKEEDGMEFISKKYKNLLRLLHPDKASSSGFKNLNMSIEKRIEAFNNVKNAYKKILKYRKESQYPDYDIDYHIEQDLEQNLQNTDFKTSDTRPENFNVNNFNSNFDRAKTHHEENGMADPYARGYVDFSPKDDEEARSIRTRGTRSTIEISKAPPKFESKDLVKYLPKEAATFVGDGSAIGYQELGITTVDDFSMVTGGVKGKLCGSDLMSVYGKNTENWEDSFARNKDLFEKYNDETDLSKKMNSAQGSRSKIYDEPLDMNLQRQIDDQEETLKMMENIRRSNVDQVAGYYEDYTQGRITLPHRN